MPGSCDSDQSSSSSLISSLRRYRFQNKSKKSQPQEISTPSSSSSGSSSSTSTIRSTSQKSQSPAFNPLSYRNYDNSSEQNLLRNISAKVQTLFKNNNTCSIYDLKLTVQESSIFRDTILKNTSLSIKWSTCVTEHPTDPSGKLYKVKRSYLLLLSKHISDVLNDKVSINTSVKITQNNQPIRTYSKAKTNKPVVNTPQINSNLNNSLLPSEGQNQGAMDDYEEFCEKEQSLRKLLDAFPGADIMEAQDILVKCNWDLNRAIRETQNQPLRATRKRGSGVPFITQSGVPGNQRTMADANPIQGSSGKFPEEIVIDSSDEEEMNGNVSNQAIRSTAIHNRSNSGAPPAAKRARRLISTSGSSEDEALAHSPASKSPIATFQNNQLQQVPVSSVEQRPAFAPQNAISVTPQRPPSGVLQKAGPLAQQKVGAMAQQKVISMVHQNVSPMVQQKTGSVGQPKPVLSVQPTEMRSSESSPSSSPEKSISVPQHLSIKPVQVSTPNNEQASSSAAMPNLPKWLSVTQVGGTDSSSKKVPEKEAESVNGNHPSHIPSNSKSAQLVRIKSNSAAVTSSVKTPPGITVNTGMSITPVSKGVSITPVNKAVSMTPVNMSPVNITSAPKTLSITPVGGSSTSPQPDKAALSSSPDEEVQENTNQKSKLKKRIKNIEILNEDDMPEIVETNTVSTNKPKTKKFRVPGKKRDKILGKSKMSGRRRKFSSDDDEDDDYGNEDIYDSEDSDCEQKLTPAHSAVLKFFQEATFEEMGSVPGCSKKKVEAILNYRPFTKWMDLVEKLRNDKVLSADLLNGAKKVLDMRNAITKLMAKCQRISFDMEDLVENLKENKETCTGYVNKQPELLNDRMHLTAYQMLGLNWLLLMHNQEVNGILADEMGLGKTVQAIAFLAYLRQINELGPHMIVVPSSTLDNWKKELETWWPTVSVICYHGSQESRRELRMQILNDEVEEFDVMITTYNMVTSSAEDRSFFKRLEFNYVVFDEAHMLKNMASQRYANLMRIKAPRRLLLTGTPLQNNLVELMSLLIFAMPHMFSGKTEQIKQMFTCVSKTDGTKNSYEKSRIDHAKQIMKPFVLRRLKRDVLKELPEKLEETKYCAMVEDQAEKYEELVKKFSAEVQEEKDEKEGSSSGAGMMMQLRRAANHPLLLRRFFDDDRLLSMAKKMLKEPTHSQSDPNMIFEDMAVMHDFELHRLCKQYKSIKTYALPDNTILNSGKFKVLEELLPDLIKEDHRILLFSQFTMVLDIIQEYMHIKNYRFLRLDGQVPVPERQQLIDDFNNDPEILVFLLSTRAGGLGINLTAADTVILHDIDFNPYNDKQAEDRCHRVGQVRNVRVIRLISEKTIEEGILQRAREKLKLERDIHEEETEENDTASVAMLLRDALGLKSTAKS